MKLKDYLVPNSSHNIPPRQGAVIGRSCRISIVPGCRKNILWSIVMSGIKSGSGISRVSSSLCNIAATERR